MIFRYAVKNNGTLPVLLGVTSPSVRGANSRWCSPDRDASAGMELRRKNNKLPFRVWDKAGGPSVSSLTGRLAGWIVCLRQDRRRVKIGLRMKLLKPSWVSHNGKLVQESGGPSWSFVVGGAELNRHAGGGRNLYDLFVTE